MPRKGEMMKRSKVSLVKTKEPYVGVRRAIELLDLRAFGIKDARVLVKPNLCSPFPAEEIPAITHPDVIGALVRYLREEGAAEILVGDEPVWGLKASFCYERSGVKTVVEREGGRMIDFEEDRRVVKKVPHGRVYQTISVPAIIDEVDILINVPKMKTSIMTLVTLCLKNLFGLVPFKDRKRFHRGVDLSYALIDIAHVIKPDLNLIDAIIAMEGMGAHSGTPRSMGLLIASADMVAAEIVGTEVMGFNYLEPVATQLALKDRLGVDGRSRIDVVGESVEAVKTFLERPIFRLVHPKPNVEVIPGGVCPGCMCRVPKIPPVVEAGKRYAVVLGRRINFPREGDFDEIWCFGDCAIGEARRITGMRPDLKGRIRKIKGCPPLDWWRQHTIDREMEERGWYNG
jgi:uncharacterized protein (DUF362 family)